MNKNSDGGVYVDQIELIAAISKHLTKEHGALPSEVYMEPIVDAANLICDRFREGPRRSKSGKGLQQWLSSHDTGLSSLYMAWMLKDIDDGPMTQPKFSHPLDPSDFHRCVKLLDACPHFRPRLFCLRMKNHDAVWKAYVKNWQEMEELLTEEMPTGRCPKLYELMKFLQKKTRNQS